MSTSDAYEQHLAEVTIGELERPSDRIELLDYTTAWTETYEREEARIRWALGRRARRLEHVGSTSVPGLAAKPIIDIVLEVADSSAETRYRPELEAAGYALRIREPDWFEHRMFKAREEAVNLHVFSAACPETARMIAFRDWLRSHDDDRDLYAGVKRDLAAREWSYVQQYADAKSQVVTAIMARALERRDDRTRPRA